MVWIESLVEQIKDGIYWAFGEKLNRKEWERWKIKDIDLWKVGNHELEDFLGK